ncbi:MAG: phosphodiester glycosidase family protein, partial [Chloroflexi bacterium]
QPYDGTVFEQAIQGWPLLVRSDGTAAYTDEDGQRARRSAIALDDQGRVLLIVAPAASFSLAEWSRFLATADLDLTIAVNLDGGSSSGLMAQSDHGNIRIDSFVPLPFALLVLPL